MDKDKNRPPLNDDELKGRELEMGGLKQEADGTISHAAFRDAAASFKDGANQRVKLADALEPAKQHSQEDAENTFELRGWYRELAAEDLSTAAWASGKGQGDADTIAELEQKSAELYGEAAKDFIASAEINIEDTEFEEGLFLLSHAAELYALGGDADAVNRVENMIDKTRQLKAAHSAQR